MGTKTRSRCSLSLVTDDPAPGLNNSSRADVVRFGMQAIQYQRHVLEDVMRFGENDKNEMTLDRQQTHNGQPRLQSLERTSHWTPAFAQEFQSRIPTHNFCTVVEVLTCFCILILYW